MDGKLFRELQESYYSVHEEDKKWIQGAIKKPGALHRELGVPEGEKIPASKLKAAAKKGGKEGQRARLAMTLKGFKKESFDVWVDALIEEGYDLTDFSPNELADLFEEGDCDSKEHEEEEKDEQKDRKKIRKMLDKEDEKEKEMGEGIDFKAARRIDAAREKAQKEKDKKNPSGKDYRLAMGKFRPGASNDERAEGHRDNMREKGTSPKKNGKKMFEAYDVILSHLLDEGYAETVADAEGIMVNMSEEWRDNIVKKFLDEELTGERLKRAETKMKSLGRRKSTLSSREALNRVINSKEGTGTEGGKKAPSKRGGGGTKGYGKVSGSGGDDMDRGSGNRAARKAANEEFELWVDSLVEEGYDLSDYTWDDMYEFYLNEAEKPFPHKKVKAKQVALRDKEGGKALERRMKMGLAARRAKEAEKTGGSQRDAGKDWYHGR